MDYESAYSTVDCVVGRRVESAHANNSTLTLLLLLLLRCCCCCVPKLSMRPSITAFPYRYVGVFYLRDVKIKTTEKNRVGFSGSVILGNRKTVKPTEKKDFRFSVHNPADQLFDLVEYPSTCGGALFGGLPLFARRECK